MTIPPLPTHTRAHTSTLKMSSYWLLACIVSYEKSMIISILLHVMWSSHYPHLLILRLDFQHCDYDVPRCGYHCLFYLKLVEVLEWIFGLKFFHKIRHIMVIIFNFFLPHCFPFLFLCDSLCVYRSLTQSHRALRLCCC